MTGPFFIGEKMLLEFEKRIADFAKANKLFDSADRVLLAVSGGADSVALLFAMCALQNEKIFAGPRLNRGLLCAHINHQLRPAEADRDEHFVSAEASRLNLPFIARSIDVRGFARTNRLSIETAARELRIEALISIARQNNCTAIATGHQKNDNAETVLQRLSRGTGFRGLAGIWPVRGGTAILAVSSRAGSPCHSIKFIRPLLCVTRDEIVQYLKSRNLNWCQDRTNADCTYRRNYIRHRLLPALQSECSGSIIEQLSNLTQSARRLHRTICSQTEKIWPEMAVVSGGDVTLDVKDFLAQPYPVKVELVRKSLTELGCGERDLTQRHYLRIIALAEQNVTGRKIELSQRFTACREYEKLIFARPEKSSAFTDNKTQDTRHKTQVFSIGSEMMLELPGQTKRNFEYRISNNEFFAEAVVFEAEKGAFEKFKEAKNNFVEWFDWDRLKPPLVVRHRQTGDRFWPLGSAGEKKVGKFLTSAKIPQKLRRELLVVADREKIIWLWPVRISEQAKVTDNTHKVLQLQITGKTCLDFC